MGSCNIVFLVTVSHFLHFISHTYFSFFIDYNENTSTTGIFWDFLHEIEIVFVLLSALQGWQVKPPSLCSASMCGRFAGIVPLFVPWFARLLNTLKENRIGPNAAFSIQ